MFHLIYVAIRNSPNYFSFLREFIFLAVSHKKSFTFFIHLCPTRVSGSILCFIVIQISNKHLLISTGFFCFSDFTAKFMGRRLSGNALSSNAVPSLSLWEKRQTQKIMCGSARLFFPWRKKSSPREMFALKHLRAQISADAVFKTLD